MGEGHLYLPNHGELRPSQTSVLVEYAYQLRHACGYYLSNKGCELRLIQDYLGHKNINNTVRYTRLNPARFEGLW